ncbi:hypothetical protein JW905_11215 [bacterium]|nr:hypothetical protein [candidate division CSSED10-310 bacterium]
MRLAAVCTALSLLGLIWIGVPWLLAVMTPDGELSGRAVDALWVLQAAASFLVVAAVVLRSAGGVSHHTSWWLEPCSLTLEWRRLIVTGCLLGALAGSLLFLRPPVDDAFISYRYAANAAQGKGLVFNEHERVEGYSNLLWILLLAALMRAGSDPVVTSQVIGIAGACGAIGVAAAYLVGADRSPLERAGALSLMLMNVDFYSWASGGLETSLHALLITGAVIAMLRHKEAAVSLLLALAVLNRTDAVVTAVLLLALLIREKSSSWRLAVAPALAVAGHGLFSLMYYGAVLPNPFYAKLSGGLWRLLLGVAYLADCWRDSVIGPAAAVFLAIGLFVCVKKAAHLGDARRELPAMIGVVTLETVYVVLSGGDWMPACRRFQAISPVVALLGGQVLVEVVRWCRARRSALLRWMIRVMGLVLLGVVGTRFGTAVIGTAVRFEPAMVLHSVYDEEVDWIVKHVDSSDVLAAENIGRLGYYSGAVMIDPLGLIDTRIARLPGLLHDKTDVTYVLARRPDWITLNLELYENGRIRGHTGFSEQMRGNEGFLDGYELMARIKGWAIRNGWIYFHIYRARSMREPGGASDEMINEFHGAEKGGGYGF